jgi:hypothetical protein
MSTGSSAERAQAATSGPSAARLPVPAELPRAIGKYTVLERIGAGAMGVVYKCSQPGLDRPVAVKVLAAALHASASQLTRFQREARAASRLSHPGIVQVYDVGRDGELHYFVMEYVDGWSLDRMLAAGPLPLDKTLRLLLHVARALQAAHSLGIIHRDIKPSNILVPVSGPPKLVDFGLAKSLTDGSALSGTGDVIGTPRYMAPEQVVAAPEEIDARADVYSLGAVMYELLTGQPPVDGPTVLTVLRRLTDDEPVPVRQRNPMVPEAVAAICTRALAKNPAARFASAGEFADAIQAYLLEGLLGKAEVDGTADLRLALPPATTVVQRKRRRFPWISLGLAVAVLVGLFFAKEHLRGLAQLLRREAPATAPQALDLSAGLRSTPRDQYRAKIEDLSAALRRAPEQSDIRWQRARAYRTTGELLAAIDDLNFLLRHEPDNRAATLERLLAAYQLYILYLGNLNEPALRPPAQKVVREDIELLKDGTPVQQYVARLIEALARQSYADVPGLIQSGSAPGFAGEYAADLAMLQADALFHLAAQAYAEEAGLADAEKDKKRQEREQHVDRASQALRRGLQLDPYHVGLLFLQANSFQLTAVWGDPDNDDNRETMLRRQRPNFLAAGDRLRQVTLRQGCDTPIARAVLWSNFGRPDMALDQVRDALSSRPTLPYLYTFRAWLNIQDPPDGALSSREIERIIRELEPAFETPPEDFNPYFVHALLHACAGDWEAARTDLRQCGRKLGKDRLPAAVATQSEWFNRAGGPATEFFYYTQEVLGELPVPVDVRIRLGEEVLKRLGDAPLMEQEGLDQAKVRNMTGLTHQRLARAFAQKEDRNRVLDHVRKALSCKLEDLTAQTFRDDGAFAPWKDDPEFVKLYAEFDKPPPDNP